jgi:hypothetical protein
MDNEKIEAAVGRIEKSIADLLSLKGEWNEELHPRNRGRFASGSGGDASGAEPKKPESAGESFVSPSKQDISFDEAFNRLDSPRQKAIVEHFEQVDALFGLKTKQENAVGAWADGAENSTMVHFPKGTSWEQIRASAAMKGHLADQKAVLAWKNDPNGEHLMFEMDMGTDAKKAHESLLAAGIQNHTLQSEGGRIKAWVYDSGYVDENDKDRRPIHQRVTDFNKEHPDVGVKANAGTGEFIGSWTSREEGREKYERVIGELEKSGSEGQRIVAGFRRISDHWRAHEVKRFQAVGIAEGVLNSLHSIVDKMERGLL